MRRSNETWMAQLGSEGGVSAAALADLRDLLLRNLRKAMFDYPVDDGFIEDAVQTAMMKILAKLNQFEGRSRFVTWATSIAIREALSDLRRARWNNVSLNELVDQANWPPDLAIDPEASPETQAERRLILDAMHEVIQTKLTKRQRMALLAELKGMPQEAIALQLNSNRNAVYKLTHDARKKLRIALETAGHRADDIALTFED